MCYATPYTLITHGNEEEIHRLGIGPRPRIQGPRPHHLMFTSLSWAALQTVIWIGSYLAFACWTVLAIVLVRYLIKKNWTRLKITLLYTLNSLVFLFAWGMIIRLALIVVTPIADTREHSIDIIWNEANRYLSDHLQFAVIALLGFVLFDLAYMRYLVHRSLIRHTVILFGANALVLFSAVYLSIGSYYTGMLQEIDRHVLGQ